RICRSCWELGSNSAPKLHHSLVLFGYALRPEVLSQARSWCQQADLCLVLGSSLTVNPAARLPLECLQDGKGRLIICNLQPTPRDLKASMRLFADADTLMSMLMRELQVPVPDWSVQRRIRLLKSANSSNEALVRLEPLDSLGNQLSHLKSVRVCSNSIIDREPFDVPFGADLELTFFGHFDEPPIRLKLPPPSGSSLASELRLRFDVDRRQWLVTAIAEDGSDVDSGRFVTPSTLTHFDPGTRLCYTGDSWSTEEQWTSGSCDTFQHTAASKNSGLLGQLQMKLFYRFTHSGLLNEVNPRQYCLTARNVNLGTDGAQLMGHNDSYLIAKTPGLEQDLDFNRNYSFYMLARHNMTSGYNFYHRIQQCNGTKSSNTWAKNSRTMYAYFHWMNGYFRYQRWSAYNLFTNDDSIKLISVGYAYAANAESVKFYFNGSISYAEPTRNGSIGSAAASRFGCLKLGYSLRNDWSFKGLIRCYGMSSRSLTGSEFQLLQDYCSMG
uniref:Deacetylase sirtuin-type domain-containing protein n=1 Tax=Macrostomum lignano TaxID=282301 RepID=A0A1I8J4T1_9PLAT